MGKLSQKWNVLKTVQPRCIFVIATDTGISRFCYWWWSDQSNLETFLNCARAGHWFSEAMKFIFSDFFTWFDKEACRWETAENSKCSLDATTTASRGLTLFYPERNMKEDTARVITISTTSALRESLSTTIKPLTTTREPIKSTTKSESSSISYSIDQRKNNQIPDRIGFQLYNVL